jgi:hypothetical protein
VFRPSFPQRGGERGRRLNPDIFPSTAYRFKFAVLVRGDVDGGQGQTAPAAAALRPAQGFPWRGGYEGALAPRCETGTVLETGPPPSLRSGGTTVRNASGHHVAKLFNRRSFRADL